MLQFAPFHMVLISRRNAKRRTTDPRSEQIQEKISVGIVAVVLIIGNVTPGVGILN